MKRLVGISALLVLAAACARGGAVGVGTPSSPSSPAASSPRTPGSPHPSLTAQPRSISLSVWFNSGETLFPAHRTVPATQAVGTAALKALLAGPTSAEIAGGVGTQLPAGTRLRGLSIVNGVATVDLSSEFGGGGGVASETMRLAQVVYTIAQFPTVRSVTFRLDGRPITVFTGDGIVLDHPVTRKDYESLLPPIVVDAPVAGARVASPITVAGTANVFEATVSIRILDESGRVVGKAFTTATCGTGCRGTYSARVRYHVGTTQPGTVMVFEASAEDGRPIHVQRVAVTLTA
jgi:germination protein M